MSPRVDAAVTLAIIAGIALLFVAAGIAFEAAVAKIRAVREHSGFCPCESLDDDERDSWGIA